MSTVEECVTTGHEVRNQSLHLCHTQQPQKGKGRAGLCLSRDEEQEKLLQVHKCRTLTSAHSLSWHQQHSRLGQGTPQLSWQEPAGDVPSWTPSFVSQGDGNSLAAPWESSCLAEPSRESFAPSSPLEAAGVPFPWVKTSGSN